jgi:hypothetical protein
MGHRWATKETQNEVADGADVQKSKTISVVNEATDIEKQSARNCEITRNVVYANAASVKGKSVENAPLRRVSVPSNEGRENTTHTIIPDGPMGHSMCGAIPTQCEDCGRWWRIVACPCKSEQVIEDTPAQ